MKKFLTAFFMAWGNFITIPCPCKLWDSKLKNLMLAMYPTIGAVIGTGWMLLLFVILKIPAPVSDNLIAFVLLIYIFLICGGMHLDGFMDVSDAVMSRRSIEERQRILKDSTVGAFAVMSTVFLMLGWFAMLSEVSAIRANLYVVLFIIPITSRACSGAWVLLYKPLEISQYKDDFKENNRLICCIIILIEAGIYIGITLTVQYLIFTRLFILPVVIAQILVSFIACLYARKQLGGMNGDIAGYSLCISEIVGIVATSLVA